MAIPLVVQRMTLAVFESTMLQGDRVSRFEQSLRIALSRCAQYGFIGPSGVTDEGAATLTTKGAANEAKHRVHPQGPARDQLFGILYAELQKRREVAKLAEQAGTPGHRPPGIPAPSRDQVLVNRLRQIEDRIKTKE